MPKNSLLLVLIATALLAGCGDGRPKVVKTSGQVLLNGEPLTFQGDGFVQVIPQDSRAATGKINPNDGTFTLTSFEEGDGVVQGKHPVTVIVNALGPGGSAVGLLPAEYGDISTSNLTVTIDQPTDSLKIELTGKLKKAPNSDAALKGDDPGR